MLTNIYPYGVLVIATSHGGGTTTGLFERAVLVLARVSTVLTIAIAVCAIGAALFTYIQTKATGKTMLVLMGGMLLFVLALRFFDYANSLDADLGGGAGGGVDPPAGWGDPIGTG